MTHQVLSGIVERSLKSTTQTTEIKQSLQRCTHVFAVKSITTRRLFTMLYFMFLSQWPCPFRPLMVNNEKTHKQKKQFLMSNFLNLSESIFWLISWFYIHSHPDSKNWWGTFNASHTQLQEQQKCVNGSHRGFFWRPKQKFCHGSAQNIDGLLSLLSHFSGHWRGSWCRVPPISKAPKTCVLPKRRVTVSF